MFNVLRYRLLQTEPANLNGDEMIQRWPLHNFTGLKGSSYGSETSSFAGGCESPKNASSVLQTQNINSTAK